MFCFLYHLYMLYQSVTSNINIKFEFVNMEQQQRLQPMKISEILDALMPNQKKPGHTVEPNRNIETSHKPMKMSEMSSVMEALNPNSSKKSLSATSSKKRLWNSSVKVDKKFLSRTADGKMRNTTVKKVLNVASGTKIPLASSKPVNSQIPKCIKPEYKAKKLFSSHGQNSVRISGICAMPETPVIRKPIRMSRQIIANKENIPKVSTTTTSSSAVSLQKKFIPASHNIPKLNDPWISGSDDSFLLREKNVQDSGDKTDVIHEKQALEKFVGQPPPMSTPFQSCRNGNTLINVSISLDNPGLYDNKTIMSFNEELAMDSKSDDSIVSLCDLLNKANLTDLKNTSTWQNDLLEMKNQALDNIKIIDNYMEALKKIKESQIELVQNITKSMKQIVCKQLKFASTENLNDSTGLLSKKPCFIITTPLKSPTYQIPKKNSCLRKNVILKSMPSVSNLPLSPRLDMNEKALGIYLNMKKHITFLETPVKSEKKNGLLQTPSTTVTSRNLQKQLDKLYNDQI